MFKWSKLKNQDPLVNFLIAVLTIFGLVTVFTTTYFEEFGPSTDFKQQLIFIIVGLGLYICLTAFNPAILKEPRVQAILILVAILTLIYLLFGGELISGTRRWITLGNFRFQPSEFAKLVIITSTASVFATSNKLTLINPKDITKKIRSRNRLRELIQPGALKFVVHSLTIVTIVALIMQQPSLGNAILALTLWLLMLASMFRSSLAVFLYPLVFALGLNILLQIITLPGPELIGIDLLVMGLSLIAILLINRFARLDLILLLCLFAVGIIAGFAADGVWNHVFSEYQRDRVIAFLDPEADPLGAQWQVTQSKIAIGSGQIFGRGLLQGSQTNSGILPFAYTDFAYAAFVEQFGLTGSLVLLGTFYVLVMRLLALANLQKDNFDRLLIVGTAIMLSLNIIVNVGMNIGIMPVTGVPLPFISYGGSSILVNFIGLGLVQMVVSSRQPDKALVEKFVSTSAAM